MTDTKEFPTLILASTISGIGMTDMTYSDIMEIASWLCGYSIYTHELAHGPTKDIYISEGISQFPRMPLYDAAQRDWQAARDAALAAYGPTVSVRRGDHRRAEHPVHTLKAIVPNAEVVVIASGEK